MSFNHISSSEFTTLCQSQLTILSQSLGAAWSVIYLTEEISENRQAQLFPFVVYPQTENQNLLKLSPVKSAEIWQVLPDRSIAKLLPDNLIDRRKSNSAWEPDVAETRQLILPLIHQETFIGLLVTGRDDREWQKNELKQVEEIARTIAIARFLESQYHWTQDELAAQENLRRIEHDRLDNLFHQLKNPLTALRTFGKLLLKRMLPNDANRKLAESILDQGDRFQALLEQFETESNKLPGANSSPHSKSIPLLTSSDNSLDQSSFLLPSSPEKLSSIDLSEVLDPLLNTARAIALERNIELINRIPATIPQVKGDLAALREIINNLIDNALKYTPAGGRIQLELTMREADNMLGIVIKDTGAGIPLVDRERVFERHYRGIQAHSDVPGTGLGLAIAHQLVTKMGGEIELISPNNFVTDSLGTTFVVWLPTAIDNEQ